jgi:hypothetical protein
VGKPHLCGILGHAEMKNFSPVVIKHDQGIQDPKRRGCDNEHVDRHRVSQVVVQEAAPSRGGGLAAPRQIPPDRGGGAPQNGLAELIRRVKSRISAFVFDRPPWRDRHRQ